MYFLLVYADGSIDQKEILMGKQMVSAESIDETEFNVQVQSLKSKDKVQLYNESIVALKKLDYKQQVRVVAWMCVVANADGFMDRSEWQLIYKIYHKELGLPLHDIFAVQKEIGKMVWEKSSMIGL
jgi:uncharacterized tellurite resistance protein B-like protein